MQKIFKTNKLITNFLNITIFVFFIFLNHTGFGQSDPDIPDFAKYKINKEEFMSRRAEAINLRRGINDTISFDPYKRIEAIKIMETQKKNLAKGKGNRNALLLTPWTEIGPNPIPNGQVGVGPQLSVSGRTTAIAVHPTNPDIVYVGTAQGGLYRTLNGGTTWTPVMDNALSLAIGAVTFAPSSPDIVYVGTGEPNFSGDSFFGVGVYRINSAASANPVLTGPLNQSSGNTDVFTGRGISEIQVHPTNADIIFVGTTSGIGGIGGNPNSVLPSRGIYRSTNATTINPIFDKLTGLEGNGNFSVRDLVLDPLNPNLLVCNLVTNGGGIYVSNDALSGSPTFTRTFTFTGSSTNDFTAEFAIHHTGGPNPTIYAATGFGGGRVYISTDSGATWTQQIDNNFCTPQCFYDIAIDVDPTNAARVYLGGAPALVFGVSTNSGVSFTNNATTASGLHVDSHVISVSKSNPSTIYFGSDGGIYKSLDAGMTWTSLNNSTFRATQFMSLALHPTDPNFTIGGTQDNGTNFYKPDATWNRVDFGDGGYAVIDQNALDNNSVDMYHTYFNAPTLKGYSTVSSVASAAEGNWDFRGCNSVSGNGIPCGGSVLFYAPLERGPGNPNTLYYGADILYRSADKGLNHTAVSQNLTDPISAIGISPQNDNVRIVGQNSGGIWGTTTGSSLLVNLDPGNTVPNNFIARAVIDPNDVNTAYVTISAFGVVNIWKTNNLNAGSPTWVSAASGIPLVPVSAFVIDPDDSNNLYAGTDIGVFASTDAGATWNPFGTDLPVVAVFDMDIHKITKTLRIATHGRGLWEISTECPVITVNNPVVTTGTEGVFFSQAFVASGGTPLYTYTTSSILPTGLTLSTGGVLNGTTSQLGLFTIVVNVTDANGCTGTGLTYNLTITCPSPLPGWCAYPNGVNCTSGSATTYNPGNQTFTLTSTNCYYPNSFISDQLAFAQYDLCGNGTISAQVTSISGSLGWAGITMRESNAAGAKKAQLMTNLSNLSRREFRTTTGGAAYPQQFPSQNRYWLRITRTGNQFVMYISPNGTTWYSAGSQNITMSSCIEVGLVITNYTANSTVTATFANVSVTGGVSRPVFTDPGNLFNEPLVADFNILPNPTTGEIELDFSSYSNRNLQIVIYNLQGKMLHSVKYESVNNKENIDLSDFNSGMYLIKVKSEGMQDVTKRLVLMTK